MLFWPGLQKYRQQELMLAKEMTAGCSRSFCAAEQEEMERENFQNRGTCLQTIHLTGEFPEYTRSSEI